MDRGERRLLIVLCACSRGLGLMSGVVSAPLWNNDTAKFAGMFTVQDVIHLIQYYYHTSSWEGAAADVEQIRLQSIRGGSSSSSSILDAHASAALGKVWRYAT